MAYLNQKERLNGRTTQAFLYKWTHIPTQKWYVGSRTALGCHVNDGYICSSATVKPMICENKDEWHRDILCIGTSTYIIELETNFLTLIDAKNDPMSFNKHNGDGKFTTAGTKEPAERKQKRIAKLIGKKKPEGFGNKIKLARTGMKFNAEWCENIGKASTNRIQSQDAKEKNSKAHLGNKNHFYGKRHTNEVKIKCGEKNKGINSASWTGYWVSPIGEKFVTIKEAQIKYPLVSCNSLRLWCKTNKNGWSFEQVKYK